MKADFTGFSFDGVHSSDLNIIRVIDGDRYTENLFPEIEDKTVTRVGADGVYYYGTFYTSRTIDIEIAFDSVTEEQYRNIRRLFGQKKICKLIFDERPYKVYYAKVASPITLNTICFDEKEYEWVTHSESDGYIRAAEAATTPSRASSINHKEYTGETRRIYKGEGSISFICYDPFAHQVSKTLDWYTAQGYTNVDEWSASSGLLNAQSYASFDTYLTPGSDVSGTYNGQFNLYNPGDIDCPYYLFLPYSTNSENQNSGVEKTISGVDGGNLIIATDNTPDLIIEPFTSDFNSEKYSGASSENGIVINTRAELIEGVLFNYVLKSWQTTGTLYNKHILKGHFGKIYHGDNFGFGEHGLYLNYLKDGQTTGNDQNVIKPYIFYDYLYY